LYLVWFYNSLQWLMLQLHATFWATKQGSLTNEVRGLRSRQREGESKKSYLVLHSCPSHHQKDDIFLQSWDTQWKAYGWVHPLLRFWVVLRHVSALCSWCLLQPHPPTRSQAQRSPQSPRRDNNVARYNNWRWAIEAPLGFLGWSTCFLGKVWWGLWPRRGKGSFRMLEGRVLLQEGVWFVEDEMLSIPPQIACSRLDIQSRHEALRLEKNKGY